MTKTWLLPSRGPQTWGERDTQGTFRYRMPLALCYSVTLNTFCLLVQIAFLDVSVSDFQDLLFGLVKYIEISFFILCPRD